MATIGYRMIAASLWLARRVRQFPFVVLAPVTIRPGLDGLLGPGVPVHYVSCVLRPGLRAFAFHRVRAANAFLFRYHSAGAHMAGNDDPVPPITDELDRAEA